MALIQEILDWSKGIAPWQSDAIARLLAKQTIGQQDVADLYALLKLEHGIADAEGRTPKPLTADQVPAPVQNSTQVSVLAIKNLQHVNAIAEKERLPISNLGLTVIYGDNGSGKSGYSRVLKRACRARDQAEQILPNANVSHDKPVVPEADFEVSINGAAPVDVHWTFGKPAPAELSALAIFDSRCARAYLDNEDDFSYVPYGLDVFEGLATLCTNLKGMLDAEYKAYATDPTVFAALHGATEVGRLVMSLSAATSPEKVEALASITLELAQRHTQLEKSLKENNPKDKATQLRAMSKRISALSATVSNHGAHVNAQAAQNLNNLADEYRAAKAAAALAAEKFKEGDNLLPGTGGEVWRELFDAARKFSLESHPDHKFPDLPADAPCPLCQQPLVEGANRLRRFEDFIQQETAKTVDTRRLALNAAHQSIIGKNLALGVDDVTLGEIKALDEPLTNDIRGFEAAIATRQKCLGDAIISHKWDGLPAEPESPTERLNVLVKKLVADAVALEQAADENARAAMQQEFAELDARRKFAPLKDAVLTAINRMAHQAALTKCLGAVKTNGITSKSSEIAEKVVSKELAAALNTEFKALGVGMLRVSLKSRGDKGKALHKLRLEMAQISNPGELLSEGEQRAIAIGSFLAEIGLSGGQSGIVFDDPVSSLDHQRRERVAMRLAQEAVKRQVIVFTHDIYFVCLLAEQATALNVPLITQSVVQRPQGFGVAEPELPFEGKTTSKRIGALKAHHQQIDKLYRSGDGPEHRKQTVDAYFHLRLTWERAVEEVLLRKTVIRFRKGIETQLLAGVTVDDADYALIDAGMAKCSNYAHDKALAGGVAVPDPDELLSDINTLENWRVSTEVRSVATAKSRK